MMCQLAMIKGCIILNKFGWYYQRYPQKLATASNYTASSKCKYNHDGILPS